MSDKGVYRTAPGTPGLLIIISHVWAFLGFDKLRWSRLALLVWSKKEDEFSWFVPIVSYKYQPFTACTARRSLKAEVRQKKIPEWKTMCK